MGPSCYLVILLCCDLWLTDMRHPYHTETDCLAAKALLMKEFGLPDNYILLEWRNHKRHESK